MTYQIKNRTLVIIIGVILLATFALGGYLGYKKADNASNAFIIALNDTIKHYKVTVNNLTLYVAEKNQLVTTQREALQRGEIERAELKALNLKKVSEITALNLKIEALMQNIPNTGTIVYLDTCMGYDIPQAAMLLPFSFIEENKWMNLRGDFDEWGRLDVSLKIPAKLDVWTGLDKNTKQYKAVVTADNPYISITGISSFKFNAPKPKRWGLGIICGYGVNVVGQVKAMPFVGVGASYSLIRF